MSVARRRRSSPAPRESGPWDSRQAVILDTGVLVALYARDDAHHETAKRWLATLHGALHTVEAVLVEAAFFLPPRASSEVARLVASGTIRVHVPDANGYERIATLFVTYADRDPDWADMSLVWLAETLGVVRIATLDVTDFSVYRVHGRKRFELDLLE